MTTVIVPSSGSQPALRTQRLSRWLSERISEGVLAFPLTPFSSDGVAIDVDAYRRHLERQVEAGAGALFVCCGTGEFFALAEDEYKELVSAAVDQVAGRVPVIAGVGYGWAPASRYAHVAEDAGADGALVMPHYFGRSPQAGLVDQVLQLSLRTELPLILYQRGMVKYTIESMRKISENPQVIGLKDGIGDFNQLQQLKLAAAPEFLFFNGALTAEMQAMPYSSIGISAYSSAIHAFAPEISAMFFNALRNRNSERIDEMLRLFYSPFVELRDRQPGYAVSLIKAGSRLRGHDLGPVRSPLMDPDSDDLRGLEKLVRKGLRMAGAEF